MRPNLRRMAIAAALCCVTACRTARPDGAAASARLPAEGLASFYGASLQGRATASGERFDKEKLTAAHRALPFGACVTVTNLGNKRQVRVRVNDRGPFVGGRVIDVSEAAARELDMVGAGVARVRLESCD